jgi:hypothetical protein
MVRRCVWLPIILWYYKVSHAALLQGNFDATSRRLFERRWKLGWQDGVDEEAISGKVEEWDWG